MQFARLSLLLTSVLLDAAAANRKKLQALPVQTDSSPTSAKAKKASPRPRASNKADHTFSDEVLADMAPLLGQCPKNPKTNEDIENAWCNSEKTIKCCNNACRYRTVTSWGGSKNTKVPKEHADKLMAEGKHPSIACCRETATLEVDGSWTCRSAGLPLQDIFIQMSRGPSEHRWHMFAMALTQSYNEGIQVLEEKFFSENFYYKGPYSAGEALAKPMVMTLGGYSTGKTTFIKTLLGKEYRGMHIGTEPTTDRYTVVQFGTDEKLTPGQILAVDGSEQFESTSQFGAGFLRSFQGVHVNSTVLKDFSVVDTPGVLSGEKQFKRDYDFLKVNRWFADRADLILLMFDVNKIDISDEVKKVINTLGPNQYKVRLVLNKADSLSLPDFVRSYGGLMYGLGRVFSTPELKRVYVGSFREQDYDMISRSMHPVFVSDDELLRADLKHLKTEALMEKLNKFIQRIKLAKAHATLLDYLRQQMPTFGKDKKKKELIADMANVYHKLEGTNGLAPGDLPDVAYMQERLEKFDFSKIPKLKSKYIEAADEVLNGMSSLMGATKEAFPNEE